MGANFKVCTTSALPLCPQTHTQAGTHSVLQSEWPIGFWQKQLAIWTSKSKRHARCLANNLNEKLNYENALQFKCECQLVPPLCTGTQFITIGIRRLEQSRLNYHKSHCCLMKHYPSGIFGQLRYLQLCFAILLCG